MKSRIELGINERLEIERAMEGKKIQRIVFENSFNSEVCVYWKFQNRYTLMVVDKCMTGPNWLLYGSRLCNESA